MYIFATMHVLITYNRSGVGRGSGHQGIHIQIYEVADVGN